MSFNLAREQFPDDEAGSFGAADRIDGSWASWFRMLVEQANDLIYLHDAEGRILYVNRRLEHVTGWRRPEILGRNILELLAPEYRASAVARREGLVETSDGRRYETEVVCRDGSRLPVEVHSTPLKLDDGRVVWQGIARDIRERRQAQARMDAVYETARQVVGILNLEQVLSRIVHHAAQITRAQSCSLWLLEDSGECLACAAERGAPEGVMHARIPAASDHPVARAFRAQGATVVDVGAGVAHELALPPGTRACVCLPLGEGETPCGVLCLTYPWASGAQPAELPLLSIFASHAAAAIANARLFEAQRRKTQEAVAIGQVGMAVASLERDAALHITGAYAYDLFQADLAAILVVDDRDRAYLRPAFIAERGREVEPEDFAERFLIAEHPALVEAIRTERPLVIEDAVTHPLTRNDARARRVAVTSGILVPMLSRDQVEGVLLIGYAARTPLDEVRVRLAETLAQQAAVAVDNAAMIRALATAKQEWEATFDAITDPVCLFSPEGTLLRANQSASRLLPAESGAASANVGGLTGRHYRDLFFSGRDPEEDVFAECLASGRPVTRELDNLSIPGVYQVSAYPLRDGDGGRAGFVTYIKDVTAQHEMQARLYHSARLAGVGELAAGVVHNFKNVLMGVSGMLDLAFMILERGGSLEEVQERLEEAQEHVFRGNQVLQRLLDFARGIPREVTDVPLDSLLPDVVALCRAHPAAEGMRVRTEVPPGLPPVRADAGQLHEVLVNLVLNAFQAMTPGGTVTISAEADDGRVRIRVADTGCGIPAEELDRIFEPFYSKRQHGPPGSGIGLSASLRTVNAMGGDIRVESEVGVGTVFTVELPCAPAG